MIGKIKLVSFITEVIGLHWSVATGGLTTYVFYAEVITPVVSVRNISDVLLCSGRLGEAVVACLSSTTASLKDNNDKRLKKINKMWIPESVISDIPKKRNSVCSKLVYDALYL